MLCESHTNDHEAHRRGAHGNQFNGLFKEVRQFDAGEAPSRADQNAQNNRVFEDAQHGGCGRPPIADAARPSEFHTGNGDCPEQQNVKDDDQRDGGNSFIA